MGDEEQEEEEEETGGSSSNSRRMALSPTERPRQALGDHVQRRLPHVGVQVEVVLPDAEKAFSASSTGITSSRAEIDKQIDVHMYF